MSRTASPLFRPSLAGVLALLALLVAMASTSYAAGLVTGKQIKNGSITGKDVKNGSISGVDIAESTLADVRRAKDAATVGGMPLAGLVRTNSCQIGKVLGYARAKGGSGAMPTTYTTSPTYVDVPNNCSGGEVEVRRAAMGHYFVRFVGNGAFLAFVQIRSDAGHEPLCSTVKKVTSGADALAFDIVTFNCATGFLADADFSLVLP